MNKGIDGTSLINFMRNVIIFIPLKLDNFKFYKFIKQQALPSQLEK